MSTAQTLAVLPKKINRGKRVTVAIPMDICTPVIDRSNYARKCALRPARWLGLGFACLFSLWQTPIVLGYFLKPDLPVLKDALLARSLQIPGLAYPLAEEEARHWHRNSPNLPHHQ